MNSATNCSDSSYLKQKGWVWPQLRPFWWTFWPCTLIYNHNLASFAGAGLLPPWDTLACVMCKQLCSLLWSTLRRQIQNARGHFRRSFPFLSFRRFSVQFFGDSLRRLVQIVNWVAFPVTTADQSQLFIFALKGLNRKARTRRIEWWLHIGPWPSGNCGLRKQVHGSGLFFSSPRKTFLSGFDQKCLSELISSVKKQHYHLHLPS